MSNFNYYYTRENQSDDCDSTNEFHVKSCPYLPGTANHVLFTGSRNVSFEDIRDAQLISRRSAEFAAFTGSGLNLQLRNSYRSLKYIDRDQSDGSLSGKGSRANEFVRDISTEFNQIAEDSNENVDRDLMLSDICVHSAASYGGQPSCGQSQALVLSSSRINITSSCSSNNIKECDDNAITFMQSNLNYDLGNKLSPERIKI